MALTRIAKPSRLTRGDVDGWEVDFPWVGGRGRLWLSPCRSSRNRNRAHGRASSLSSDDGGGGVGKRDQGWKPIQAKTSIWQH